MVHTGQYVAISHPGDFPQYPGDYPTYPSVLPDYPEGRNMLELLTEWFF